MVAATRPAGVPLRSLRSSAASIRSKSTRYGEPSATYFVRRSLMPVLIDPGSTVVSHTSDGEHSCRAPSLNPFRAAFDATYDERYASGNDASIDPTMTTRP